MPATLQIALRDSATATRPYVVVNPLLAKHLPASPWEALAYFQELGVKVAETCRDERVLVIGFAETATAVGAAVAAGIEGAVYCHTTREEQPRELLVAEFREEHSHARQQALYLCERWRDLSAYERLVFVEDEITTGKTILGFLREVNYRGRITVAALVFNGFDTSVFAEYDAAFCYLQKFNAGSHLRCTGLSDPRSGTEAASYQTQCECLAREVIAALPDSDLREKNVLVLGTEEFMYPALVLGSKLERLAGRVRCQATTRSPLLPRPNYPAGAAADGSANCSSNGTAQYPIATKCEFASVYDPERATMLYNLEAYDTVLVMTDAPDTPHASLIRALWLAGNSTIHWISCGA